MINFDSEKHLKKLKSKKENSISPGVSKLKYSKDQEIEEDEEKHDNTLFVNLEKLQGIEWLDDTNH